MKYTEKIYCIICGIACCFIILNRLIEVPILGWLGDILLITGSIIMVNSLAKRK